MRKKTNKLAFGFDAKVDNGKYTAVCKVCGRQLQNTALARLKIHRKNCKPTQLIFEKEVPRPLHRQENLVDGSEGRGNENLLQYIKVEEPLVITNNVAVEDAEWDTRNLKENSDTEQLYEEAHENLQNYIINIGSPQNSIENKSLSQLKVDKMLAEIDYFEKKTNYLTKEFDNVKLERTVMLLKVKKLRLEIEKLEKDY